MNTNFKKLSAYTIAKNCCDLSDVNAGIDELHGYLSACRNANIKPATSAYIRLAKLVSKRDRFAGKEAA
jgi:hypothetical protein